MKNSGLRVSGFSLGLVLFALFSGVASAAGMVISPNDIGGVVRSVKGPEAGVWVIAKAHLPEKYLKIVVTDSQGRYVLPELPKATYKVWVRGYGLIDSKPVTAHPGMNLNLEASIAPNAHAAAQYYPASYWFSLLRMPPPSAFPGTGPGGNGISPAMRTQQDWIGNFTENCNFCHTIGNEVTRGLPPNPQMWDKVLLSLGGSISPQLDGGDIARNPWLVAFMNTELYHFGRGTALKMLADWSGRIAAGAVPEAPPRPEGRERDIVITEWGWAGGHFVHDLISTDKRDPRVNADGPVVGVGNLDGIFAVFHPASGSTSVLHVPSVDDPNKPDEGFGVHTDTMDQEGRVWSSDISGGPGPGSPFCSGKTGNSPYAKYFPRDLTAARWVGMYDPRTGKLIRIQTCFGTHHLNFAKDHNNTLYFSGDPDVLGWINTNEWDRTHDWKKAVGWCPYVLDTSGKGEITPKYKDWNEPGQIADPSKDTRLSGFPYGMAVAPDGAVWLAKYSPQVPSGVLRVSIGKHPPYTCKTEYWEAPKMNGVYKAFNARGVDLDSKGIAWVDFGSGMLGRFDRRRCKVTKGPSATGQQCPEGWTFYREPGPSISGEVGQGSADWSYLTWIDHENAFGLGKDTVFLPGSNSDSIMAFLPKTQQWLVIRIPYPMGAYPRGLDARIDDPAASWKGREIWSSDNDAVLGQVEGGPDASSMIYKIQLRPNPLAH